jgi:multidrug efflux pump subunit AcrA (membrane-fusion protein)
MDIPRIPKKRPSRTLLALGGAVALALVTVAMTRVGPAVPSVDRATVVVDTVRQGPLVREIRGPGQLVPEQIRYVTTLMPGRVERVLVRPGTTVEPSTLLLELGNPDVNIQALEADQQLTAAQAQLVALQLELENGVWGQEAQVATAQRENQEAARQAHTNDELSKRGLVARVEVDRARERAGEQATRVDVETKRLALLRSSVGKRLAIQKEQVARLSAIAQFQRDQVAAMNVRAGAAGVLQELALEVGQWVTPGTTLAVVAQPGRLKAVLRIAETQAREVVANQRAVIDTRSGIARGHVSRIDPAVQDGTVTVEVVLDGPLPAGARPDMSVDGTIEIERMPNVLSVGRPAVVTGEGTTQLYRLEPDGHHAVRVPVRLGRSSVHAVEVRGGLKAGDVVVLSDMSAWDDHPRVRIR